MSSTNVASKLSLSRQFWGLDWSRLLPWTFEDVVVESVTFDEAIPFMRDHYAGIFGAEAGEKRFLASPMTEAKRRFCDASDVFLFRTQGRAIGLYMANPADWSTYYIRSVGVLPEFRERKLLTNFVERTWEPLRAAGVERVEAECSPANATMMRVFAGQGFIVTSIANSERWGSTVRFTKFLAEEAETIFLRQFNSVTSKKRISLITDNERSTS